MATNSDSKTTLLTVVATAAVATLIAQHIAGKATRDALFLTYFPVEQLPLMMMVSAAISVAGVLLMSRLLARFGPARLIPVVFALSTALLLLQWALIDKQPRVASALLYLQISSINSLLISGFWSVINEKFDPHSAKQVIARLAAAATFGGLAGGVLAKVVSSAADTHAVLLMLALMHGLCGMAVWWICRDIEKTGKPQERISLLTPLRSSNLIRTMALLALLVATLAAVLDYILKAEAAAALTEEQLISFFSYFYVAVGLGGFLLQATVGNRALRWLGLGGTMIAWPIAILVMGGVTLIARSLVTAALLRGTANVLYNSFYRTGFEVLYTPIPAEQKRTGKVMIDVGADRAGDLVGGFVVMVILLLPVFTESVLLISALALAALCAILIVVLQRNYSKQLADNLRSGQLQVDDVKSVDATTVKTIAETQLAIDRRSLLQEIEKYRSRSTPVAGKVSQEVEVREEQTPRERYADPLVETIADLRSGDPSQVRRALASRELTAELLPHAVALLGDDTYTEAALKALRPVATRSAGYLVDILLDSMQPSRVRRRIPIILGHSRSPLAMAGLLEVLGDREWDVRYRAAEALDTIRRADERTVIDTKRISRAISKEIGRLRQARPGEVNPSPELRLKLVFLLIGIGDNPETVQLCWRALHSEDRVMKGTAVEYLENRVPAEIWQELLPHLDLAAGASPGRQGSGEKARKKLLSAAEKLKRVKIATDRTDENTH